MSKREFVPSVMQQAVFDFVSRGKGSANVIAVAGSGKSTTVVRCLPLIPEQLSVLILAFNAIIAGEMKEKIVRLGEEAGRAFSRVQARTFHSLGNGALFKKLGATLKAPDGGKVRAIAKEVLGEREYEMYADFCCRLVSLAKGQGVGAIVAATEESWFAMIRHHDLFLDEEEATEERAIEIARDLLRRSNERAKEGVIDFDDQLYVPLLWRLRLWQNDWVFIDEAQDTNPVRRALARLALRPGGRLIAVGDPRQAIYGFTGASHDAMDLIKEEFRCVDLPLTVSYRCPKAVARHAQEIVDHFSVPDDAPEGSVEELSLREALPRLGPGDAILCRNSAPLVKLAFTLIGRGVGLTLLGRDLGKGLVVLVQRQKAKGIPHLVEKLRVYQEREIAKFTARGEEAKAEQVADRVACIQEVIDHLAEDERTVPALCRKIEGMFGDGNTGLLVLSTMHKVKGKEYRNVAILRQDLCPSKWARQEWAYMQELNLMYVARTRAMDGLLYLTDEGESLQRPALAKKEAA